MDGYKRRTEEKKRLILQAAIELFQQYGLEKVTMRDIAKRAGVSHVTVYKYFQNQSEITRQIIKAQSLSILHELQEIKSSNIPVEEKLDRLIFQRARIAAQSQRNQLFRIIARDPELKDLITSAWQNENSKMELELLEEGIKGGYVSTAASKETMQLYLDIIRDGLSSDNERLIKLLSDEKAVRELHQIVLHGLLKR